MKLNFRKYSRTLAVFRDFEFSFWHGGATRASYRQGFTLTRVPKRGGRLTNEVEEITASSIWGVIQEAAKIGLEVVAPSNWPDLPSNFKGYKT